MKLIKNVPKDNLLVKFSLLFFSKWRATLLIWLAILLTGTGIYTSVIQRDGFPTIQFPLSIVSGTYFVDDATQLDKQLAQPLSQAIEELPDIASVQMTSQSNFFTAAVFFDEDVTSESGASQLQNIIDSQNVLPSGAQASVKAIDPAGFLSEYDMLLSVYSTQATSSQKLEEVAAAVAQELSQDPELTNVEVQHIVQTAPNPSTGETETRQVAFSRVGLQEAGVSEFYQSVNIGLDRRGGQDVIEFSEYVAQRLDRLDLAQHGDGFEVQVTAEYGKDIKTQISSLQNNLLGGLVAVAIVSFLLITWRASIITALFMVTVMLVSILVLHAIGYTLNTITLFALVLALGLFVDDATIIVESLDANRSRKRAKSETVRLAVRRVAAASFAGTMTTVLAFAPLMFITGVLGEFIRIMPVTIIVALLCSLVLSLTLIPFLSRFLLLGERRRSRITQLNPLPNLESRIAQVLASHIRNLKVRPRAGFAYGLAAVTVSVGMVLGSFYYAGRLSFNIFPPSKDSNRIAFQVNFPDSYNLQQAEDATDQLNQVVGSILGDNIQRLSYGSLQTQANHRQADAIVELTPFTERELKAPLLIEQLQAAFDQQAPEGVRARVIQIDAGPPVEEFPLQIQVYGEDSQQAEALAEEVRAHIDGATLTRSNGKVAHVLETKLSSPTQITRQDGRRYITVQGAFDADDVSALLALAEDHVTNKFNADYLTQRGYAADALGFDFGQESDNAESFSSLSYIFPIALLLMFVLLAVQFRSLAQPLLIFLAIPFTFFGVFAGLYVTDNALSFFVQVGLVGLIGIAVNNTILLTDYANQERRAGKGLVEAVAMATQKRFRPLVATSLTTVVALLPLALSDPFWEALSMTIIFGLLSSTFLVVLAFPYYYLAFEYLRRKLKYWPLAALAVLGLIAAAISLL